MSASVGYWPPTHRLTLQYVASFDEPGVDGGSFQMDVDPDTFEREIAPARTFCLASEVEALQAAGLGKGANRENTVVLGDPNTLLRMPGEAVRHKILDLLGDLRLLGADGAQRSWENKGHYFGAAAEAMRCILIDRARAKGALKRGGDRKRVVLELDQITLAEVPDEILDLDRALQRLAKEEPAKAELVKLRFFAGLNLRQAAAVLDISLTTANCYWAYARAWLFNELRDDI